MALRSPTAAHSFWGAYATAADLPNANGAALQSGNLEAGDRAYVTATTSLYVCTDPTLNAAVWQAVGGGAGAGGEVIWAWNGTDLSQFRIGGTPELDTTGGAALTLSSFRGQANLRFRGGGSFGFAQWVIDPAEFPAGIPSRYVLEIIYDQFDNGAGTKNPNVECGVSFFCRYNSPGNVRAWSLAQSGQGNNLLQIFTRLTTFAIAGATPPGRPPGVNAARTASHRYQVTQQVGTPFDLFYQARMQGLSAVTNSNQAGGINLNFDSGAYDGVVPNTLGVAYRDNVGQTSWCEMSMIRMLQHPADVVG